MFSAKQAKFWKIHLDIEKPVKKEPMLDEIKKLIVDNRHSIRQVVFLGGEPTLMESWYSFLDFLVVQEFTNQVTVVVTSNCNWTDKIKERFFKAVEAFLDKGGKFDIRISGEGDRQYFNSIRKFSDYDVVSKNMSAMTARFQNRVKYTLQPVMNGLSVYSMKSWLELFSDIFKLNGVTRVNLNFAMLTRPNEFLTIHQGTKAVPSLNDLRDYLSETDLFHPKQRMISVVESQISLLTNEPNHVALDKLDNLLAAHDKILPHTWSSTDAIS
jgi:organic radical activating enzyme